MKRAKSDYTIQAVAHALELLDQLRKGPEEMGVTEISKRLRLHKNNVFRLLATLESGGYVEQNQVTQNYRLGVKVLELGQAFIRQTGLVRHAGQVLQDIVSKANETAYVGAVSGDTVVYLSAAEANQTVRVVSRVGHHLPVLSTAVGKAQAAFWTSEQIDELLRRHPLQATTPNTITDVGRLKAELAEIARRGWAFDNEEYESGVKCVAAPVYDYSRRVRGAITVSAPSSRMTEQRVRDQIVPVVKAAALQLSHHLGYEPGPQS